MDNDTNRVWAGFKALRLEKERKQKRRKFQRRIMTHAFGEVVDTLVRVPPGDNGLGFRARASAFHLVFLAGSDAWLLR